MQQLNTRRTDDPVDDEDDDGDDDGDRACHMHELYNLSICTTAACHQVHHTSSHDIIEINCASSGSARVASRSPLRRRPLLILVRATVTDLETESRRRYIIDVTLRGSEWKHD